MACVGTSCGPDSRFFADASVQATFASFFLIPFFLAPIFASFRFTNGRSFSAFFDFFMVPSDLRLPNGSVKPLGKFLSERHPTKSQAQDISPIFKKIKRDAQGDWCTIAKYRLNGVCLVELGQAFSMAVLLKGAGVQLDNTLSCKTDNGVMTFVPSHEGCFLHFNEFAVLISFIMAVCEQPMAMFVDIYVANAKAWLINDHEGVTKNVPSPLLRNFFHAVLIMMTLAFIIGAIVWRSQVGYWPGQPELLLYGYVSDLKQYNTFLP